MGPMIPSDKSVGYSRILINIMRETYHAGILHNVKLSLREFLFPERDGILQRNSCEAISSPDIMIRMRLLRLMPARETSQ